MSRLKRGHFVTGFQTAFKRELFIKAHRKRPGKRRRGCACNLCQEMPIVQQTKYLVLKNFHIKKRNKRETLQEILVPIWWILLLLIIRTAIKTKVQPAVKENEIPTANISTLGLSNRGSQGNTSIGYVTNNIPNAVPVMELVINASKDAVDYLHFNNTDSMVSFYMEHSSLLAGIEFAKGKKNGLAYTLLVPGGLPSPKNKLVGECRLAKLISLSVTIEILT